MYDEFLSWIDALSANPRLHTLYASLLLVFVAWLSNWVVKRILVRGLYRIAQRVGDAPLQDYGVVKRLSPPCRGCRKPPSPSCATSAAASSSCPWRWH